MNIRAHHLLCMRYFKGKGYSKKFVSNFAKVLHKLKKEQSIKIINHPDVICSPCPHNSNNKCIKKGPGSELKVRKKDNAVIEYLGITLNQKIKTNDAFKLVNLNLVKLKGVCKDCEWKEYCTD